MYALVCFPENSLLPSYVEWKNNMPEKGTTIKLLRTGDTVKWIREGNSVKIFLPASVIKTRAIIRLWCLHL
jgi:alpha-L-fucosidase